MSSISRQNSLLVAESWTRIYEALVNVDFRSYDQANLVQAIFNYLKNTHAEEYNDYAASSEFMTKVEILAWLSQNLAFRTELNSRENFLATAERRDSLIKLAQNVGYKVNRVKSASGNLKINAIRTTESIVDSNDVDIQNRIIVWNDVRDEDWFERIVLILNNAFSVRTPFGSPVSKWASGSQKVEQYILKSAAPQSGAYTFSANVNGLSSPFDIYNSQLDSTTGAITELSPIDGNAFNIYYRTDGTGYSSNKTGMFMPFVQGNLTYHDVSFTDPVIMRTVDIPSTNINNDDFFVQEVASDGSVISTWTKVDTVFGEGVSFASISGTTNKVYELETLVNDGVRVKFGDGNFGKIPVGNFRFWYRAANSTPAVIRPDAIQNQTLTIPYVNNNTLYYLTLFYSLEENVSNGVASDSNLDIRSRVGKVFYTQNRMVNAQDYNNFYLKDSTVMKSKVVNRTYTGQSRYSRLNEPTSLYQNVAHVATDGRIYVDTESVVNTYSADTTKLTSRSLISQYVQPLLKKKNKNTLYYNRYAEKIFSISYTWSETSIKGTQSYGNVKTGGVSKIVGSTATDDLKYIQTGSVLRLTSPRGQTVVVDRVTGDGTATDGIALKDVITNNSTIFSVMPPYRNTLSDSEVQELSVHLDTKIDFGMSWDMLNQKWVFITAENINKTADFSLDNQGNTSGGGLDASWMIRFDYVNDTNGENWSITDRGDALQFESAREVDFILGNSGPLTDPLTGKVVWDTISVHENNEAKQSARRKNVDIYKYLPSNTDGYFFTGDGATTTFYTQTAPLDSASTFVLLDNRYQLEQTEYEIVAKSSGYGIKFITAPANGAQITVLITTDYAHGKMSMFEHKSVVNEQGFALNTSNLRTDNAIAFLDSILQTSNLDDFIFDDAGGVSYIQYDTTISAGITSIISYVDKIDNLVFYRTNYFADGLTTVYTVPSPSQTVDTILVAFDGIVQAPSNYTVTGGTANSTITFASAPPANVNIRFISVRDVLLTRTENYEYTADGTTTNFALTKSISIPTDGSGVMVFLDGILQYGPWSVLPAWSVTGNEIQFITAPQNGEKIHIYHFAGSVGNACPAPFSLNSMLAPTGDEVNSALVKYLGKDALLTPVDNIRHADGYINKNGLVVEPIDADIDGVPEQPFFFQDFVSQDMTDLVLWRAVTEFGFEVFDPIDETTTPKGTYSRSGINDGTTVDTAKYSNGDIHYDVGNNVWLIADTTTGKWAKATDQSKYRYKIGRSSVKFSWKHYASESTRIDPSKSNIMNVYILTSGYDSAYRIWLAQNGDTASMPVPETSEQLKVQFTEFEKSKPISDSIIYYPATYKPLFGKQAISELQADIKIIQTVGSTLTESDLKLRVLSAIDAYFQVDRWEFGESFYFTELVAFVHSQVAPDLQSMVIVPKNNNQAFGRMFQVRAEPNEMFISAASPEDVKIVKYFTDSELKIGTLV